MTDDTQNKPITFRNKAVFATIKIRDSKNGPFPEARIGRSYKNARTGEWGISNSFGRGDIEKLTDLLPDVSREMGRIQKSLAQQPEQTLSNEPEEQAQTSLTEQLDQALAKTKPDEPTQAPELNKGLEY